jgi:hypothetical protein
MEVVESPHSIEQIAIKEQARSPLRPEITEKSQIASQVGLSRRASWKSTLAPVPGQPAGAL